MKKILALLLTLMMLFSVATVFAGCGDSESKKSSSSDDEKKDDENKDDENKDDENKDDENKDDENKDDENKDDENKDDENKDDENKDDEKKDDENKDDENKDDENKGEENKNEDKPVVDSAMIQELQEIAAEAVDSYYGLADEINMEQVPDTVYDYYDRVWSYTKEDIRGGYEAFSVSQLEWLELELGSNISTETEVSECKTMTASNLEQVAEQLWLSYGDEMENVEISNGYFVVVEVTLTGDDDTATTTDRECAVVCSDGQWYFMSCQVESNGSISSCDFFFVDIIWSIINML